MAITMSGVTPQSALALSIPFAVAIQFLQTFVYTLCAGLPEAATNALKAHKFGKFRFIANITVILFAIVGFLLGFLGAYSMSTLKTLVAMIPDWLLTGLNVAGGMLPAIGFAMIMTVMLKKQLIPFALLGYALAAYLQLPVIGIAIIALVFALKFYFEQDENRPLRQMQANQARRNLTMTGSNQLTNSDYRKTTLRSYFLQNGFNYSNYQGLGYSLIMYPAFKKLYGKDPDKLAKVLSENIEFYNTNPNLIPFITSIHLAMADNGMEYKETRGIKMALMGPLAGIGDSLSQFCIAPLFSTIFASLAMNNVALAPVFFVLAENFTLLSIKFAMGAYGKRLGTSMIEKLSAKMSQISEAASMIGVTVIAGLAATFVKMKVTLTYASSAKAAKGAATSTVDIQALLDKVAPALLPVLYTLLMYYLIKKRGWTTYKLVILTVVIGIVLSLVHILGV